MLERIHQCADPRRCRTCQARAACRTGMGDNIFAGPDSYFWTGFYEILATVRDTAYRLAGQLSPAEKQQIQVQTEADIRRAAAGNEQLAQTAIAQARKELAIVFAQASGESAQANYSKLAILAAVGIGGYLVLRNA